VLHVSRSKISKRLSHICRNDPWGERAGLSLGEWFWKSEEAGIKKLITPIILRTAHTCIHIRENLILRQAGKGGFD
jgi:hypothetical protein